MAQPTITDWISSIASLLGIPIIIWGIIKLFIKDKSQERKLNSLESLAISQDEITKKMAEQINELAKQTSEYQYQSELMKESNNLISKQIELQNDIFLHNQVTEEKKLELQKIKRINELKPYFINNGGSSNSEKISISLKNKGNTARNLRLEKIEGNFINFKKLNTEIEFEQNKILEIVGTISSSGRNFDNSQRAFKAEIYFEDMDGNKYKQRIIDSKIGKPELIEK